MPVRVVLPFFAPIPVGHHVTVIALEVRGIFSSGFEPSRGMIVCDDDTRIVYAPRGVGAESMTYDNIHFDSADTRFSASIPPLRGQVLSCVVWGDSGERTYDQTIMNVEPDTTTYRGP